MTRQAHESLVSSIRGEVSPLNDVHADGRRRFEMLRVDTGRSLGPRPVGTGHTDGGLDSSRGSVVAGTPGVCGCVCLSAWSVGVGVQMRCAGKRGGRSRAAGALHVGFCRLCLVLSVWWSHSQSVCSGCQSVVACWM